MCLFEHFRTMAINERLYLQPPEEDASEEELRQKAIDAAHDRMIDLTQPDHELFGKLGDALWNTNIQSKNAPAGMTPDQALGEALISAYVAGHTPTWLKMLIDYVCKQEGSQ